MGLCKICIGCSICLVVVLAIMIPVGILVIAPKIGQHAVDSATLYIDSTISMIGGLDGDVSVHPTAYIQNDIIAHNPIPLSAKLGDVELAMYVPASDNVSRSFMTILPYVNGTIATFTQPEATLKHGNTSIPQYNNSMDLNMTKWNNPAPTGFFPFAFTLALGTAQEVYIIGEPKLTALGFVTMKVKLAKRLTCMVPPQQFSEVEAEMTSGEELETVTSRRLASVRGIFPPVAMKCTQLGNVKDLDNGNGDDIIKGVLDNLNSEKDDDESSVAV